MIRSLTRALIIAFISRQAMATVFDQKWANKNFKPQPGSEWTANIRNAMLMVEYFHRFLDRKDPLPTMMVKHCAM